MAMSFDLWPQILVILYSNIKHTTREFRIRMRNSLQAVGVECRADRKDCGCCLLHESVWVRMTNREQGGCWTATSSPRAPIQAEEVGIPKGPETAADLRQGYLCHPEMEPQFNTRFAARLMGSRGSMPSIRDCFKPQKNDKMFEMTPVGAFFLVNYRNKWHRIDI